MKAEMKVRKDFDDGYQAAIEHVLKCIRTQHNGAEPVEYRKALARTIRVLWAMSEEWETAMAKQNPTVTDHVYPAMPWEEEEKLQKKSQFWLAGISDVNEGGTNSRRAGGGEGG